MSYWLEAAMLAEREASTKAFELKPLRRRSHTGRNFQLLLKVKREMAERFAALADDAGVCFGEFLEKTLDAYVREQEGRAKGGPIMSGRRGSVWPHHRRARMKGV